MSNNPKAIGIFLLLLSITITIFFTSQSGQNTPYNVGELVGTSLVYALIAIILTRPFNKNLDSVLIIGLIFIAVATYKTYRSHIESLQIIEIAENSSIVFDKLSNGEILEKPLPEDKNTITGIMKELARKGQEIETKYLQTIENANLSEALSPETLVSIPKIIEKRKSIKVLLTAINSYEDEMLSNIANAERKILETQFSFKKDFLSGFNPSKEKSIQFVQNFSENQREIYETIASILNLAEDAIGDIAIKGDELQFLDSDILAKYNSLVLRLHNLAKEESKISQSRTNELATIRSKLDKLL